MVALYWVYVYRDVMCRVGFSGVMVYGVAVALCCG